MLAPWLNHFPSGPDSETYLAGNPTDENGPLNVLACDQLEDQITDRPQASVFARLKSPCSEKCAIWIRQSWARLSQSVTRTVGIRSRAFYWVLLSEEERAVRPEIRLSLSPSIVRAVHTREVPWLVCIRDHSQCFSASMRIMGFWHAEDRHLKGRDLSWLQQRPHKKD
jgi:hypothetical protein